MSRKWVFQIKEQSKWAECLIQIIVKHIISVDQVADILTKAISSTGYHVLRQNQSLFKSHPEFRGGGGGGGGYVKDYSKEAFLIVSQLVFCFYNCIISCMQDVMLHSTIYDSHATCMCLYRVHGQTLCFVIDCKKSIFAAIASQCLYMHQLQVAQ